MEKYLVNLSTVLSLIFSVIGLYMTYKASDAQMSYIYLVGWGVAIANILIIFRILSSLDKANKKIIELNESNYESHYRHKEKLIELEKEKEQLINISNFIASQAINQSATPRRRTTKPQVERKNDNT